MKNKTLPPYSENPNCVKCGGKEASSLYRTGMGIGQEHLQREHIARTCLRCHYEWDEATAEESANRVYTMNNKGEVEEVPPAWVVVRSYSIKPPQYISLSDAEGRAHLTTDPEEAAVFSSEKEAQEYVAAMSNKWTLEVRKKELH